MNTVPVDVVVFGGGVAGLWTLHCLREQGYSAILFEAGRLGAGQTVAAQGIIHGGLKYTLQGVFTAAADSIREMPGVWRNCLSGRCSPHLQHTQVRADHCHLWRLGGLRALASELGAKLSLRVKPHKLPRDQWPAVLREVTGDVHRIEEQVIDPVSLVENLAALSAPHVLALDAHDGVAWRLDGPGQVRAVEVRNKMTQQWIEFKPQFVVLAAGKGNAELRERVGLRPDSMQCRPLHMVIVRGNMPVLNGHCIGAAMTPIVTITSSVDSAGRTVWQLGGKLAEDGIAADEAAHLRHAQNELAKAVPGLLLDGLEWATYRVDRAEAATAGGARPDDVQVFCEGNVITAWPTKLALAPRLADRICDRLDGTPSAPSSDVDVLESWPKPQPAQPPWELQRHWTVEN